MTNKRDKAELLLVAAEPEVRNDLARWLGARWRTAALSPEQLDDRVHWLDAGAAVAVLEAGAGEAGLERLAGIRELPAGSALVLLYREGDEGLLAEALDRLDPSQVVAYPGPDALLRFAVERVLPPGPVGTGARKG
ncbi:MAG: hypothetical protein QNK03_10520, partial [Myxococcota bacterium]|nr:hypothetical protein [Myxococcota bacterium]